MSTDVRQFVLDALSQMNYKITDVDDDTPLGTTGVDMESLAIAELTVRAEDIFGARFSEEEAEAVAAMTLGEFVAMVESRRPVAVEVDA
ncbi:MAG: acyl carrier protein [Actinocatenispora sp.]